MKLLLLLLLDLMVHVRVRACYSFHMCIVKKKKKIYCRKRVCSRAFAARHLAKENK